VYKFPSNRVVIRTLIIIIIYLIIDFSIKGKRDFFQLNYDWNFKQTMQVVEKIKIDTVSYDYLKITITSPQDYSPLNTNTTYCLNDKYYFRSTSIEKGQEQITFKGVYWINIVPKNNTQSNRLAVLNLPMIQNGSRSICMIGDSQVTWLEGKYTRRDILKKVKNGRFIGNSKDLFGYAYQAQLLNNTETILDHIGELPLADTYVLFIGAHEPIKNDIAHNIKNIVASILNKKSKLILVIPPNYIHKSLLNTQKIIKITYLQYKENPHVKIIDLSSIIENPNLFLMDDGIHLNLFGHQTLTKHLIDALNNIR
jgi:hypothetical protein